LIILVRLTEPEPTIIVLSDKSVSQTSTLRSRSPLFWNTRVSPHLGVFPPKDAYDVCWDWCPKNILQKGFLIGG
jgi:hypothetical protein